MVISRHASVLSAKDIEMFEETGGERNRDSLRFKTKRTSCPFSCRAPRGEVSGRNE